MEKYPENSWRSRLAPIAVAMAVTLSGCSGEQLGTTNDGIVAGGSGLNGTTAGIIGGIALVGVLLAVDDDDSGAVIASDGMGTDAGTGTDSGTGGGADSGTGTDSGTDGGADSGTGTDSGTDGGADSGTGTDSGTGGGADSGTGTDSGTGGGTDSGTGGGTDSGSGGGTDSGTGGGTDSGTGSGTDSGATLEGNGMINAGLFATEVVADGDPASAFPSATGVADIFVDRVTGDAMGSVQLNFPADRVDIMLGPPGSNGFVAVALENVGDNRWVVPDNLSAAQQAILLENINVGNLYLLASTDEQPNGILRRQIISSEVTLTRNTVTTASGATANGFVLLNRNTREYAITFNTLGAVELTAAHLFEGDSAGGETVIRDLAQRPSNPARFFDYGTFSEAEVQALDNGLYGLDAHDVNGVSVIAVNLTGG